MLFSKKLILLFVLISAVQWSIFTVSARAENPAPAPTEAVKPEPPAAAQPGTAQEEVETTGALTYSPDRFSFDYFKGYFIDTGKILTSPLRWEKKDWIKAGVVAGVTTGLYFADEHIRDFARRNQSSTGDFLANIGNRAGEATYLLPPLGGLYLYGQFADDAKARKAALLTLESYAITGLFTQAIKLTAQRHRPLRGVDDDIKHSRKWDGPTKGENMAFISGHTSSAFSMATVIADVYKDSAIVPPLAYGLATLTGLARVYSDAHWSSDVFVGAALGYFTGKAITHFHKDDKAKRVRIIPEISPSRTVLNVEYRF